MPAPTTVMYVAIWDIDCRECDTTPVVGIFDDHSNLRSTGLCGTCFFADPMMVDWDLWDDQMEAME